MAIVTATLVMILSPGCSRVERGEGARKDAVELTLVRQDPKSIEFSWRFTNTQEHSVFVAVARAGHAATGWDSAPVALPIPPSDLLFAYGDLRLSEQQQAGACLHAPVPKYVKVPPGQSVTGHFTIVLPFVVPPEPNLRSVFLYEGTRDGPWQHDERSDDLSELTSVWLAVQYSLVAHSEEIYVGLPEGDDAYQQLWRRAVIDQAVRAEKRRVDTFMLDPLSSELSMSTPIKVRIPLAKPITLYYQEPRVKP